MGRDAAGMPPKGRMLAEAPWLLTPAIAIAITVLSVNLIADGRGRSLPQLEMTVTNRLINRLRANVLGLGESVPK